MDSLKSKLTEICKIHIHRSSSFQLNDGPANSNGNMNVTAAANTNANKTMNSAILTRNPYTVLSLDLNQLSDMLNISLDNANALKKEIAFAIASHESCCDQNHHLQTNRSNSECKGDGIDRNPFSSGRTDMQAEYRKSFHLQQQGQGSISVDAVSTGSKALNRLISKPSRKRPRQDHHLHQYDNLSNNRNEGGLGGIQFSKITQVSGSSGTGKTQLALTLSANALANSISISAPMNANTSTPKFASTAPVSQTGNRTRVHYIASGGGSAGLVPLARRARQILFNIPLAAGTDSVSNVTVSQEIRNDMLNCMRLDYAPDGYHLLALLHQIEHEFQNAYQYVQRSTNRQTNSNASATKNGVHNLLLVIDSISGCLAPLLYGEGDGGAGAALLNEIQLTLRRISRASSIGESAEFGVPRDIGRVAIFITNGMVSDQKHGAKPALGEMWRAADTHFVLEPGEDVAVMKDRMCGIDGLERVTLKSVKARLVKDSFGKVGDEVDFGISSRGIVDKK